MLRKQPRGLRGIDFEIKEVREKKPEEDNKILNFLYILSVHFFYYVIFLLNFVKLFFLS